MIFIIDGQFKYLLRKVNFEYNTIAASSIASSGIMHIEFKKMIAAITGEPFYIKEPPPELNTEYIDEKDRDICLDLIRMIFNQK